MLALDLSAKKPNFTDRGELVYTEGAGCTTPCPLCAGVSGEFSCEPRGRGNQLWRGHPPHRGSQSWRRLADWSYLLRHKMLEVMNLEPD